MWFRWGGSQSVEEGFGQSYQDDDQQQMRVLTICLVLSRITFDEEQMNTSILGSATEVLDDSINVLVGWHNEIHGL